MFSRRHPYLFFILIMTLLTTSSSVIISLVSGVSKISAPAKGEKIGVVEIDGVILESDEIVMQLKKFRERKDIKAVVLRINSPGGGVAPSQEISMAVDRFSKEKKIIASLGSVAASGGYYIASAADSVIANKGTITGSIGVIMEYTNIEEIMDKIGIEPVVIKSGKFKDTGSPTRPMREDEEKYLQDFVDGIHTQFVTDVASGREMSEKKVREFADGRIFSGENAVESGFADKIGNFEYALDFAAESAGINKDNYQVVYPPKEKFSFVKQLIEESASKVSKIIFQNKASYSLH